MEEGMHKIKFIHLLQNNAQISLATAKAIKDKIVDNKLVEIEVEDSKVQYILKHCKSYGVIVEIVEA